jgi:hypothetical protein
MATWIQNIRIDIIQGREFGLLQEAAVVSGLL